MRSSFVVAVLLLALACVVLPAQEPDVDRAPVSANEVVNLVLPAGDPEAGKRAFAEHLCFSCHRVSDDPDYNTMPPLAQGPDLASSSHKDPGYLATAIVAPNHSITRDHKNLENADPEDFADAEGDSIMPDFNEVLTVRELIDLLSYLRTPADPR